MGQVLDSISPFADEIRADGAEGDQLMRLTDRSAKRLKDAGVIRMLQPKEFGGLEAHPREFAETAMALGAMDGATGWVSGIVGVHPWEMAFFDPKAQQESGARIPTPGSHRPTPRWVLPRQSTADTSSTAAGRSRQVPTTASGS